jgi:hypothetical protein
MVRIRLFRSVVSLVVLLAFLTMSTACYGPFNLTRALYKWNGSLRGDSPTATKWIVEGVFLGMVLLPVYGATLFIDGVILNSIEFWTGNPLKIGESEDGKSTVVQAGSTTATVSFSADGSAAHVVYARDSKVFRTADVVRHENSFRMLGAGGQELYTSTLGPAGQLVVADKDCRFLGSVPAEWLQQVAVKMEGQSEQSFLLRIDGDQNAR